MRIREGGKDAVKSRVHSRLPFSVCFGLKRGRSCGAECMPSGERGLWKRDEGGCGSGPGCHSAVLYKVIPDKADQRQGQWRDFHSLTFILICMCVAQSGTE